jgi:alkylation response protein AidB-like acyl-CoA dehydrogenase
VSISWTDRCGKGLTLNLYQLSDDYRAVREAVRDVCENVIAPTAATTDIVGEFPTAGYAALRDCEFHAPRIAEDYGGPGADALATAIIVEEVARACATCALIPAINSLCTQLLQDAASEEIKREYLPPVARGEAMMSFCLSEPEAGSDIRAMSTRAEPVAGGYRLNGTKRWITHAGISAFYLVFAVNSHHDGSPGISGFIVEKDDPGLSFGRLERKMGIKGSPTREVYLEDVRIPASRLIGEPGSGLRIALNALDHGRVTIAAQGCRHRAGRTGVRNRLRPAAQAVRQADRGNAERAVHARRHGDEGGGRAPPDLRGCGQVAASRRGSRLLCLSRQVLRLRHRDIGSH